MTGYRVTVTTAAHTSDQIVRSHGTLQDGDLVTEQGGMGVKDLPTKLRELAEQIEKGSDIRMINIEQPQDPDPQASEQQTLDLPAAQPECTDSPQELAPEGVMPREHLPSRELTPEHLPSFDVRTLDPHWWNGPSLAEWNTLWNFALTFDGYGVTRLGPDILGFLAEAVRRQQPGSDWLRHYFDLSWLRVLLFVEQQRVQGAAPTWELCPPDHANYLQQLLDAIRKHLADRPEPIQTKHLTRETLPELQLDNFDHCDKGGAAQRSLSAVWPFALTFDAVGYFGGGPLGLARLETFGRGVRSEFDATGGVPELAEIGMLRACLAHEERRWHSSLDGEAMPSIPDAVYISGLLAAIRDRLP